MQNKTYKLPNICCRCGERQATHVRPLHGSRLNGLGFEMLHVTVKRAEFSFNIPVCVDCQDFLDKREKRIRISRNIFSLVFALSCFLYLFVASTSLIFGLVISIMVFLIMRLISARSPVYTSNLGGFNGRYFWFSNRSYLRQFAELNPQLVSPIDHSRFFPPQSVLKTSTPNSQPQGIPLTRSNIILLAFVIAFVVGVIAFCLLLGWAGAY